MIDAYLDLAARKVADSTTARMVVRLLYVLVVCLACQTLLLGVVAFKLSV